MRPTVRNLICSGLGYCCPWAFFCLFRRTSEIASRLGVTSRAVRYAKHECTKGTAGCEGKTDCLARRINLRSGRPH